jgi:hypothetical protein
MESAMLSELELLGFCFSILAMILVLVKYERRLRRWSLRHPRRRGKFRIPQWHPAVPR